MASSKQRGSEVIYVAGSACDLPPEVQEWLDQADDRASACADVHDALALLATGERPTAMIVSMDAVDWNELDFFDHVSRLHEDAHVYVAGHDHHREKLEAACGRGARLFDAVALNEDLETPATETKPAGPAGLLAGSLQEVPPAAKPAPVFPRAHADTKAHEPDEKSTAVDRPTVRLVSSPEIEEPEVPVPVPWAPSPDRPQRTPPRPPGRADDASAAPAGAAPEAGGSTQEQPPSPVELTPEELAALLGKPADPDAGARKRQQQ